jgi:hypothetical protein
VRTQAPDDDVLEPLPVFIDGVAFAPIYARREAGVDAPSPPAAVVEATAGTIAPVLAVREIPLWSGSELRSKGSVQVASIATFSRLIALRASDLDSLPDWWRLRAAGEQVEIARRLFLSEPQRLRVATWRMRGWLLSPWLGRSIPVELWLWPRLEAWAKLTLEPRRSVQVGRRYFRRGHQVLDALCAELVHELTSSAVMRPRPQG